MKKKVFIGLVAAVLLVGITSISHAATFSDNFDDPDFTNSHWLDGNDLVPQTWSFVPLNGSDLGYRATIDVPPLSTEEPAVKIANNAIEYFNAGLYIETLVRIGYHDDAYDTDNEVFIGFSGAEEGVYLANLQLNFEETTPIIDLSLSVHRDGLPNQILADTAVSIDFDTFCKLVVQVDSDEAMNVFLYNLSDTLLGSVSSPKQLSYDKGAVVIGGIYASTFNDFNLSGSPVPIPGAIWLLGSGLVGLVGFRRKFKK